MAIYFLNLRTFGRSNGSSAVSAAAYRSGERLRDERTGRSYDHSARRDVLHKEIMVPEEFASDDLFWTKNREQLWNAAEAAERRANARVAREFLVAIPPELSEEQRIGLVRGFSRELVERYRFALDVAIHAPRDYPGSDPRNFHAHLLATTREVALEGPGAKTSLEWNDRRRHQQGMGPAVGELLHVRERWADAANVALEQAHVSARIDHRTLAAQGIDREPGLQLPKVVYELERHGYRSFVAERMRAEHEARVAARLERAAQPMATPAPENKDPDAIRRQAIENWRKYREAQRDNALPEVGALRPPSRKNDHSL
jgi:ATP-dependent exoDNAse (exonuclease V) alpha subunit